MDILWSELTGGIGDAEALARFTLRLVAAVVLGAIVGLQREQAHKPAGLRTHILVSAGTALFVIAGAASSMTVEGLSRVVQGITTGIGFIGAGCILKLDEQRKIQGLTTSASVWMTAAIGAAAGLGCLGVAILSAALGWLVLAVLGSLEQSVDNRATPGIAAPTRAARIATR